MFRKVDFRMVKSIWEFVSQVDNIIGQVAQKSVSQINFSWGIHQLSILEKREKENDNKWMWEFASYLLRRWPVG